MSVACGQYHTVMSLSCGGIIGFGKNDYGQLGTGVLGHTEQPFRALEDVRITQVSCGYSHTVCVSETCVYSFGMNNYGQLGLGDKVNRRKPFVSFVLNLYQLIKLCIMFK